MTRTRTRTRTRTMTRTMTMAMAAAIAIAVTIAALAMSRRTTCACGRVVRVVVWQIRLHCRPRPRTDIHSNLGTRHGIVCLVKRTVVDAIGHLHGHGNRLCIVRAAIEQTRVCLGQDGEAGGVYC